MTHDLNPAATDNYESIAGAAATRTTAALLFLISGTTSLIYQVVWMRMLIRVFGITLYATATIVAVFMAGLALGSWLFGRLTVRRRFSLRLFAGLELLIAVTALLVTWLLQQMPTTYAWLTRLELWSRGGVSEAMLRLLLAAALLLVPTVLMGATLPILTRWLTLHDHEVGRRLAVLYGLNTLGAVVGVVFTGFFSIGHLGETTSVVVAVGLDLVIAAVLLALPGAARQVAGDAAAVTVLDPAERQTRRFYLAVAACSGCCALAYEVLWTRMLVLLMGSSVYAFSGMLALYLTGIGLGSLVAARWVDRLPTPAALLAGLQIALAAIGLVSLYLFRWLGLLTWQEQYLYSPLNSPGDLLRIIVMGALIILPLTVVLGLLFPLMARIVTPSHQRSGQSVGELYAWNTVGGVTGTLAVGFLLLPFLGLQACYCFLCLANLLIGVVILLRSGWLRQRSVAVPMAVSVLLLAFLLPIRPGQDFFREIILNRLTHLVGPGTVHLHREERAATVTSFSSADQRSSNLILINGIMVSARGIMGQLMAHMPLTMHPDPANALVICFGAGSTFRAAVDHVGQVDAVELVAGVVESFKLFYPDAERYLQHSGVRVSIDDGRSFVLTTSQRYDVIVIDASPPIFAAGTVNLYSLEMLELARSHLREDGIMFLWVPFPCFESDVWSIAANFCKLYDNVQLWAQEPAAGIILIGSAAPLETRQQVLAARIRNRGLNRVAPWLTGELISKGWRLDTAGLRAHLAAHPTALVTDDHPATEYPLARFLRGETFWRSPGFLEQPPADQVSR